MTSKERQLIIDSVHHWEVDILARFHDGDCIIYTTNHNIENLYWKSDHSELRIFANTCPLCINYNIECVKCLWFKFSGKPCYEQEYSDFADFYIDLFSAKMIVGKLWAIGLQDRTKKHFVANYKYYYYN